MKLLTLFSAVFLLSSTAVNTTLAFQQVAYAETESLSEETQHSSTEETTNSADRSEDQETTEESSEEQSSSEATDDSTTASQEEAEEMKHCPKQKRQIAQKTKRKQKLRMSKSKGLMLKLQRSH